MGSSGVLEFNAFVNTIAKSLPDDFAIWVSINKGGCGIHVRRLSTANGINQSYAKNLGERIIEIGWDLQNDPTGEILGFEPAENMPAARVISDKDVNLLIARRLVELFDDCFVEIPVMPGVNQTGIDERKLRQKLDELREKSHQPFPEFGQ